MFVSLVLSAPTLIVYTCIQSWKNSVYKSWNINVTVSNLAWWTCISVFNFFNCKTSKVWKKKNRIDSQKLTVNDHVIISPVQMYRELLFSPWHWHRHGHWQHTLKVYIKVCFMWWARLCEESYPVIYIFFFLEIAPMSHVLQAWNLEKKSIYQVPALSGFR